MEFIPRYRNAFPQVRSSERTSRVVSSGSKHSSFYRMTPMSSAAGGSLHIGKEKLLMPVSQKITTFLWFDNNAEEAIDLYISIFKNSKIVSVTRNGEGGPGPKGTVLVAAFQL